MSTTALAQTEAGMPPPVSSGGSDSADFRSILFGPSDALRENPSSEPDCFRDLNLDQIVTAVIAGRDEYDLGSFFHARLSDHDAIAYRHEVFRDLENPALFRAIKVFAERMRAVRQHLAAAGKLYYQYEQAGWFLDGAGIYGEAVEELLRKLSGGVASSRGLVAFSRFLERYAATDGFTALRRETKKLKADLAAIRYGLVIRGNSFTVRPFEGESDYSAVIEATFEKFKQGAVKSYLTQLKETTGLNHIEAQVLEGVARLFPAVFAALEEFRQHHQGFVERTVGGFDREIQFYVAWREHTEALARAGLKFCYPQITTSDKNVAAQETFDLALAGKLVREKVRVVCNDFSLTGSERIIVVTGPNNGGKTTFARTFGQLHWLAALGLPVPGATARLFLFDRLFVHFEREEKVESLRGKLQDDLVRIHAILDRATTNSVVLINEIFSSTTVKDAVFLGRKILSRLAQLDLLCVCVTFLDELASVNEKTVSLVAAVVPENPTLRTFRIERRPADGLSHAVAIAEKYRLTYEHLKRRIKS